MSIPKRLPVVIGHDDDDDNDDDVGGSQIVQSLSKVSDAQLEAILLLWLSSAVPVLLRPASDTSSYPLL